MPSGNLPIGWVRQAPGLLGEMLSAGTFLEVLVEYTAVWMWLRPGSSWATMGTRVQTALREALAAPDGWTVEPAPGEVLQRVVVDVLDGSVGDFIRSHGGAVSTERSGDDVVVTLGGACEHCPAAGYTLRLRLMGELQRRCPGVVDVGSAGRELRLRLEDRSAAEGDQ